MTEIITTRFQLRRGYEATWNKNNPILQNGEPGFVIDLNKIKIGDGKTPWRDLQYLDCSCVSVTADSASLKSDENNIFMIFGFDKALPEQFPFKGEDGKLKWTNLSQVAFTGMIEDLQQENEIILDGGSAPVE